MVGILPDIANGGLVIRDGDGVPTNPAGVQSAYSPPAEFTSSCLLTALPSDCTARMSAAQINAIVSELLCFMASLNPDGTYNCASLCNIANAFDAWWDEHNNTDATIDGDGTAANLFRVNPLATVAAILAVDAAGDSLASGLRSTDATNILTTGTDGRLFVPPPVIPAPPVQVLRSYLAGLTLSTNGGVPTFGIAAGVAVDSTNSFTMALAAAMTKTTAAWVVGSGNGGLDTGVIAASTWYHAHLIRRPDTGVVDVLVSLSPTAPTLPPNYTQFRRIGSMKTSGTSQWVKFIQRGDKFLWDVMTFDVNFNGTTAVQVGTLSVPSNVIVNALVNAGGIAPATGSGGSGRALIFSPDQNSASSTSLALGIFNVGLFTSALGSQAWTSLEVQTGLASDVRFSTEISSMTLQIYTAGWIDRRGKDN